MSEVQENKQQNMEMNQESSQQSTTRLKKVLNEEFSSEEIQAGELEQLEVLQETYKIATVGMQSIEIIRPMVKDKALKNILFRQYNNYKAFAKEIELQAATQGYDLKPSNILNKAVMYGSTLLSTIADRSTGKLAEIMIQGINMGIISLLKVTNNIDAELQIDFSMSDKLMQMLQNNLESLKAYL